MNKLTYISLLVVLCSSPSVLAQHKKPAVITRIELAFERQQSEWKVMRQRVSKDLLKGSPKDSFFTHYRLDIDLKSAEGMVLVLVTYWKISQNTRDVFKGHAIAFDNTVDSNMTKSKLPKLGDENYMWAASAGGVHTTIHFRKGHVHAIITGPSLESAERFARVVAAQI